MDFKPGRRESDLNSLTPPLTRKAVELMRRIIMLLAVALVMGAMMVAMAAPAFAAGALFLASEQGTTLQVTPQTTTQGTITKTFIPSDPFRAVCVPPNPIEPVCQTIT